MNSLVVIKDHSFKSPDVKFSAWSWKNWKATFFLSNVNIWQQLFLICLCQEDEDHEASVSVILIKEKDFVLRERERSTDFRSRECRSSDWAHTDCRPEDYMTTDW